MQEAVIDLSSTLDITVFLLIVALSIPQQPILLHVLIFILTSKFCWHSCLIMCMSLIHPSYETFEALYSCSSHQFVYGEGLCMYDCMYPWLRFCNQYYLYLTYVGVFNVSNYLHDTLMLNFL